MLLVGMGVHMRMGCEQAAVLIAASSVAGAGAGSQLEQHGGFGPTTKMEVAYLRSRYRLSTAQVARRVLRVNGTPNAPQLPERAEVCRQRGPLRVALKESIQVRKISCR
jgi:hypothetical protein